MKKYIYILFFTLLLFACLKEDKVKKEIDSDIIGTWSNRFRNYTFNDDNSFSLLIADTGDLDILNINFNVEYDSLIGSYYTINSKKILVVEINKARSIDTTITELIDISSSPEVNNYSISGKKLTLSTSTSEIEYIKL